MSEPADDVMTCERASDLLVELACGELTPELTAAVRTHAQGCGRCSPALAKLTRVLQVADAIPLSEPSRGVEERILRAAREALAARAGGTEAQEPERTGRAHRGWFGRLSEWALSPQVAMASVLLLMVGIGLYALPIGRDQERVAFEAAPEERAPAQAPAATATAVPMQESEEAAEEHAQREQALAVKEGSVSESKPAPASKLRARSGGNGKQAANIDLSEGAGDRFSKDASGAKKQATKAALPEVYEERKGVKQPAGPTPSAFAPAPPASNAPREPSASKPESSSTAAQSARGLSADDKSSREDENSARAQKSLSEGIAAARRGAYAQAVSLLSPLVDQGPESTRASARLWLARSLRGQGKCDEALRYYGPIVQQSKVANDVLNEAADCYERTGDPARAGQLRARLGAQD